MTYIVTKLDPLGMRVVGVFSRYDNAQEFLDCNFTDKTGFEIEEWQTDSWDGRDTEEGSYCDTGEDFGDLYDDDEEDYDD